MAIEEQDHGSLTLCREDLEYVSLVDVSGIQRRIVAVIRLQSRREQHNDRPHLVVVRAAYSKQSI